MPSGQRVFLCLYRCATHNPGNAMSKTAHYTENDDIEGVSTDELHLAMRALAYAQDYLTIELAAVGTSPRRIDAIGGLAIAGRIFSYALAKRFFDQPVANPFAGEKKRKRKTKSKSKKKAKR